MKKHGNSLLWLISASLVLISIVSGCVCHESTITHSRQTMMQYHGEQISQSSHNHWTMSQPVPMHANIALSSDHSKLNVMMSSPEATIAPYPHIYPHLMHEDCYTIKPVIVNGEQASIIQPCK